MTEGRKILNKVLNYFNETRKKYPQITDDLLCDNGKIYYMNRKDGTKFDWKMNGRCCEFYLFYKKTECGFIKVFVNDEDTINGYIYLDNGYGNPISLEKIKLNNGEALYLASLLQLEADNKGIYDETIDKINFDKELRYCDLLLNENNKENDEW